MNGKYTVITLDSMKNAIQRAKQLRPKVKIANIENRQFYVESANDADRIYLVEFEVAVVQGNSERRGNCRRIELIDGEVVDLGYCQGFDRHGYCYHIAASAGVNYGIQKMRKDLKAKV